VLIGSNQKVREQVAGPPTTRTEMLLPRRRMAGLSHSLIVNCVERGNPVYPPFGAGETVRHAVGHAGVRGEKKQMPSCNRLDTPAGPGRGNAAHVSQVSGHVKLKETG
jgi:hypothetical protein